MTPEQAAQQYLYEISNHIGEYLPNRIHLNRLIELIHAQRAEAVAEATPLPAPPEQEGDE